MARNTGSYDELASEMCMAHHGGKQLKPMKDATYYVKNNLDVLTDAVHHGTK